MSGVNKWIGIGNVTKDPEVRQAGDTAVCTIRIACNDRIKKDGQWVDHAEFVDVVCWGKTAENVGEYVRKGKQLYVEGKLRTREYEKDGVKKYKTEVNADQVVFLADGKASGGSEQRTSGGRAPSKQSAPAPSGGFVDDDLPFDRDRSTEW